MSIRLVIFAEGEIYHIYNRGNSKQKIFHDQQDHSYFISLLISMNTVTRVAVRDIKNINSIKEDFIVSIGAYCLMQNHFHILIKQEKENGISKFMQKVSTAYVMYYNKKYKHTGALFEGKFKSKYAGEDTYLKYLFAYIHLNPLKILDPNWKSKVKDTSYFPKMLKFLIQYQYSSFNEYYVNKFIIINKDGFPDYFPTNEAFTKDITSWFQNDIFI
jgi:putative transposase